MAKEIKHALKAKPAAAVGATQDVFKVPPPVEPIGGISGNPPLPPGRMVTSTNYTDEELATLKTIPGWNVGDPVPDNLAVLLDQVRQEHRDEMAPDRLRPPVSPDTPPLSVPVPTDIGRLPPEEQARLLASIEESTRLIKDSEAARHSEVSNAGPGVNDAIAGRGVREISLEDDTDAPTYAGTDIPKQPARAAATPQTPSAEPVEDTTGASTQFNKLCQHCGWDQRMSDIPEPDDSDKQRYLIASAGMIAFQKAYDLFGGNTVIVLRELTPGELDLCYKQAHIDRRAGQFDSPEDFYETVQRYRICLQLVRIESAEVLHSFPDTVEGWAVGQDVETTKGTILPTIYESIYGDIVKTESFNRVLGITVSRFNRLLAKMEANADNENFWKGTAQPA